MSVETVGGLHTVLAVLRNRPGDVVELFVSDARGDRRVQDLIALAGERKVRYELCGAKRLEQLSQGKRHQGVIARVKPVASLPEAELFELIDQQDTPFILILDGVTDPHNFGACLRSAEAAGVDVVIAPRDHSAPLNETVARTASGALESVPVCYVGNLARTMERLQAEGVWITGTTDRADNTIFSMDFVGPVALAMGAEGRGLRRLTSERCDFLAVIPMAGQVSSLNVSVATGVCLFEVVRQRALAAKTNRKTMEKQ